MQLLLLEAIKTDVRKDTNDNGTDDVINDKKKPNGDIKILHRFNPYTNYFLYPMRRKLKTRRNISGILFVNRDQLGVLS